MFHMPDASLDWTRFWPLAGLISGFVISLCFASRRNVGLDRSARLMSVALPLLLAGGKLVFILEQGSTWTWQGLLGPGYSLYGSFAAVLGFWLFLRLLSDYPLLVFLDCVTPGAALALGMGRIGCFLRGCCGGMACDLPWGVQYPPGTAVYSSQLSLGAISPGALSSSAVHPTQLYESIFGFLSFTVLAFWWKEHPPDGSVFFAGMLGYGVFRFCIEPFRIQTVDLRLFGLFTLAQAVSLLLVIAAIAGLLYGRLSATRG